MGITEDICKMSYQSSPYKEKGIKIGKTLGWASSNHRDPKSKIMEVIKSGKAPGCIGEKTGDKWG